MNTPAPPQVEPLTEEELGIVTDNLASWYGNDVMLQRLLATITQLQAEIATLKELAEPTQEMCTRADKFLHRMLTARYVGEFDETMIEELAAEFVLVSNQPQPAPVGDEQEILEAANNILVPGYFHFKDPAHLPQRAEECRLVARAILTKIGWGKRG